MKEKLRDRRQNTARAWSKILGRNYSAAQKALTRSVSFLYFLNKQNGKCFRCKKRIYEDDWHLDHIKSWATAPNPIDAFWNVENLAASHAGCNVREANNRKMRKKSC